MKYFLLAFTVVLGYAALGTTMTIIQDADICSYGPVYWCKNITTSEKCKATKHCIQTVWNYMSVPEDNDDVCQICKDMVKQARDQLESNITQEELKEVLEGSCKLIPLKVISEECCKLADDFIPELIDSLASQMNPDVVCTVAGLCNNARIDQLLEEKSKVSTESNKAVSPLSAKCLNCKRSVEELKKKIESSPNDDILNRFVEICGKLGSFSDSCASIVITYYNDIYGFIMQSLQTQQLCTLSGICSTTELAAVPVSKSSLKVVVSNSNDDLTCDFCKDLVQHVKNILIANTTEEEFKQVLEGICRQTKSFKSECLNLVEEYGEKAYDFLVESLDPVETCDAVGLCNLVDHGLIPVWPLLSKTSKQSLLKLYGKPNPITKWTNLPIDYQQGEFQHGHGSDSDVDISALSDRSKQLCTFCQYLLHFLQQVITSPTTETELKKLVDKACYDLPESVQQQCLSFVSSYGDAMVALLAQEIDPSLICPELGLCAAGKILIDIKAPVTDKPECPLCLFAIQELISKLKDNKTEESIKEALDTLCNDLPQSLSSECQTFVKNYFDEIIQMILADFTPQEVCVYLHLCDNKEYPPKTESSNNKLEYGDSIAILTNNVEAFTDHKKTDDSSPECVICEFIFSKLEDALKDAKTEEEIKHVVHSACNYLPRTVQQQCGKFIDEYADLIISLLVEEVDPSEICTALSLCSNVALTDLRSYIHECTTCEYTVAALEKHLGSNTSASEVKTHRGRVCENIPDHQEQKCYEIMDYYGPSIANLFAGGFRGRSLCTKIDLCPYQQQQTVKLIGGKKCTWGPTYWCQSRDHASSCGAVKHCEEQVWGTNQN